MNIMIGKLEWIPEMLCLHYFELYFLFLLHMIFQHWAVCLLQEAVEEMSYLSITKENLREGDEEKGICKKMEGWEWHTSKSQ